MESQKKKEIVKLFHWTKEEIDHLNQLPWKGQMDDTILNRKFKHLCFLFELTYALSIAPSLNRTNNPNGEWELKHYAN